MPESHGARLGPVCRRWDLNPHERNAHCALNAARLPIPPLRRTTNSTATRPPVNGDAPHLDRPAQPAWKTTIGDQRPPRSLGGRRMQRPPIGEVPPLVPLPPLAYPGLANGTCGPRRLPRTKATRPPMPGDRPLPDIRPLLRWKPVAQKACWRPRAFQSPSCLSASSNRRPITRLAESAPMLTP